MFTTPPPPRSFGIIELQAKTRKIFEFKGLIRKIFRNKDLAPKTALKMGLGQLRGPFWETDAPRNCPNQMSNYYGRVRRDLCQRNSITNGLFKKVDIGNPITDTRRDLSSRTYPSTLVQGGDCTRRLWLSMWRRNLAVVAWTSL